MDGTFPNHHPDPTVDENLDELIERVRAGGGGGRASPSTATCDRIGAIDETGRILWGDQLVVLFARDVLERTPGAPIVGEVKCSRALVRGHPRARRQAGHVEGRPSLHQAQDEGGERAASAAR